MPKARRIDARPGLIPKVVRTHVGSWESPKLSTCGELSAARRVVLKTRPQTISEAVNKLEGLADYVQFLRQSGVSTRAGTEPAVLFRDAFVVAYEVDLGSRLERHDITPGTHKTLLSRNLALARALGVSGIQVVRGGRTSRTAVSEPMSDAHFADWETVVDAQPPRIRLHAKALLYGARGAGMDSGDFRETRGVHVHRRRDGAVVVDIKGEKTRPAVVLDRYGDQFLAVAQDLGEELLVGRWPHRHSPVTDLLDAIRGGAGLPRPLPQTLRRAYIAEVLSADLSVAVLVRQLGRHSLSEIQNALPYAQVDQLDTAPLRRGYVPQLRAVQGRAR
ncbi:hypothetical protein QOZ88_07025 [Blastococcus sp. BMG 814]|uniref:Phage integrase family protein n=1 Tax=Blastococcus carthaginiensis TaxID=3050034 RepID=A0ABT9I9Y7_9ACTN|nr:hypothetical protein [Blastococcus carthaginiensis]MDP5182386.1 hypothetical protein [Blastococcus carthaginiensis]